MKTTARAVCTHPDCQEFAVFSYETRKEASEDFKRRQQWKCTRHSNPDKVLSVENPERIVVLTATRSEKLDSNTYRYWHDGTRLGSGFSHSDAHKAWATDFPEGTKLIITARIELPSQETSPP